VKNLPPLNTLQELRLCGTLMPMREQTPRHRSGPTFLFVQLLLHNAKPMVHQA
jgi:hypothetical protein